MSDIQKISERIRQLRLDNHLEQTDVAEFMGYKSFTTISKWENGKNLPTGGKLVKLAQLFGTTTDYILHGISSENSEKNSSPSPKILELDRKLHEPRHAEWISHGERLLEEQEAESTTINEPLYEYKVFEKLAAGNGYTYFNDGNFDIVFHDEKMDHDFASWVFGDSMEPTYLNGEVVLIKQTGFDYDGAIYAVDWDGQTYIKKVYKEETGLRLVSLNKKYADKFAPYDEDPRIIGKIVGHFQPMTT
ncbi:XRE family transcriptional regulator [Streptococcus hyovaginalis]